MLPTRGYGLSEDNDYGIQLSMRFQLAFGIVTIPMHAMALFILLRYSRNISRALRTGFLINQIQMFLHDFWAAFLLRVYPILPYPIFYCQGIFCSTFSSISMFIEIVFMIHAVAILLFMLLMMHQQILPPTNKYHFKMRTRIVFVAAVYVVLWSDGIAAFLSKGNVADSFDILQTNNITWLAQRPGGLLIYGDERRMGPFRNVAWTIMLSIIIIAPLRTFLIGTSVRFLNSQKALDSRTTQLKKRVINVLFQQTAIVSFFYVYPLLVLILMMYFSVSFLPDSLLLAIRMLIIPISMLNSVGQFYIQIRTNAVFQNSLRHKASKILPSFSGLNKTVTVKSEVITIHVTEHR